MLTNEDFWGAVLIEQSGEIILRKAYGIADVENNIENRIDTAFYIGSATKQFTGAAILMLEADDILDTSDTLDVFFPEYDIGNLKNVTVKDLLAMRGGFGGIEFREMAAVTSKDGVLRHIGMDAKSINSSDTEIFNVSLNMPQNVGGIYSSSGYYAYLFLWDSNTFVPICDKYAFP